MAIISVKFVVFTAVTIKITVLWDVTQCSLLDIYQYFHKE
jgi:hypothetical protein